MICRAVFSSNIDAVLNSPNGSVSSSLKEPPPDIAPKLSTSAASSEPSRQLLDTSEPSVFSHLSPNPFSPYADNNSRTITSPPTSDVPSQDRFNKRLPTIPSSSEIDSQDAAEMLASSELDEQAPGSGNSSRPELPRPAGGISGLGLGMLFGLVGHGRRAISLNGADDFAERENKRSTTSFVTLSSFSLQWPAYTTDLSDPLPRSKRSQMFEDSPTLDSVPRRVEISSSSSSDGESDNEETAFLPYTANSGSADPLVTRWSRTTFGKKIGSSVGSGSAAQSMAGSILSRQSGSNQASLSSNAKRRANSVGRRAVSESDSVHSSTRGSRRTQNSSGSSSGHSHSKSSKRSQSRLRQEVPRVMPDAGSSVLERSDDEDETKPTIRTVKRTQSGTSVYT